MTLADSLRTLSLSAPDPRSDGELVAGFVGTREEPAFAELLRRHGPTVYGVCRRVLGNGPDADDAFQAVFLVLARKASTIRPPGMVGPWLYGVAVRTANKARVMNARRAKREQIAPRAEQPRSDPDTLAVIDAELAALPAVYRAAFVACELNGRSRSEAAKELGWPEGTVAARLAKARELLAARLRKRGVTLGVGLFAAAAVPPAVAAETLAAVRELLAVGTATAVAPAAQQLSEEVANTMTAFKLKLAAVLGLLAVLTFGWIGGRWEGESAAAPVPKPTYPDGLLWVFNDITFEMAAFTPDGTTAKEFKLSDGRRFLGVTPDGKKLAFVGKGGKSADPKETEGLTVHLRAIGPELDGTDTGLKYETDDFLIWSADVQQVVRYRQKREAGVARGGPSYVLYDLPTKKETQLELPAGHGIFGWSPDGKWLLVGSHQLPGMWWSRWSKYTLDDGKLHAITAGHAAHRMDVTADGKSVIGYANAKVVKDPAARGAENWQVVRIDVETGGWTAVENFVRPSDYSYGWVRPAPRGERFLFWAGVERKGEGTQDMRLSVHDADGSEAKLVKRFDYNAWGELGWFPDPKTDPRRRNAPLPKAATAWKEATPIAFADGGRVTSVAYSPSGKTIAVARDAGKIDFYDTATRKHITTMTVGGEKGVTVATVTAVAFCPEPHAKHGDIFAVTHKNGVKFGTVGLGIFADDAAKVDGIPPNIAEKDFDPHQLTWLTNDSIVATNGTKVWEKFAVKEGWGSSDWEQPGTRGQPVVLAALPGQSQFYLNGGHTAEEGNEVQVAARPPMSSPQTRLSGHKSRPIAAAVSPDGKRVVSADAGGTLIVWEGGKLEFKEKSRVALGEGVAQLAIAPDGKTVAVVRAFVDTTLLGTSGRVLTNLELHVFDTTDPPAKPKPLWSARNVLGDRKAGGPFSLAFGPDGTTLLAAFADPYYADKDAKSMGVKVWERVPRK